MPATGIGPVTIVLWRHRSTAELRWQFFPNFTVMIGIFQLFESSKKNWVFSAGFFGSEDEVKG